MTQKKLQLYFGLVIRYGTVMTLFNQLPKGLTHFLPPSLNEQFFGRYLFLSLCPNFFLHDFILFQFFQDQLKLLISHLKALEICETIVFNFVDVIILIFSCFSALDVVFFAPYFLLYLVVP